MLSWFTALDHVQYLFGDPSFLNHLPDSIEKEFYSGKFTVKKTPHSFFLQWALIKQRITRQVYNGPRVAKLIAAITK